MTLFALAWDQNGERFELPEGADCWLVTRERRFGQADVLYADGVPLRLRLDATIEDLRAAVDDCEGTFRLEVLDARCRRIRSARPAIIRLSADPDRSEPIAEAVSELALAVELVIESAGRVAQELKGRDAAPPIAERPAAEPSVRTLVQQFVEALLIQAFQSAPTVPNGAGGAS